MTIWPNTLAGAFMGRCLLDPQTNCWNWQGKVSHSRSPVWSYHGVTCSALRLSWELFIGAPPTKPIKRKCGNPLCVRPDHLTAGPELADRLTERKSRASPFRKLSPDAILEIRSSRQSKAYLALKFGVSKWTIWAVKRGKRGSLLTISPPIDPNFLNAEARAAEIARLSEMLAKSYKRPNLLQTNQSRSPLSEDSPYAEETEQQKQEQSSNPAALGLDNGEV